MEQFNLMNGENKVLSFSHEHTLEGDKYFDLIDHMPEQLPFRLRKLCSEDALADWIKRRVIPVNRHHVEAVFGAIGTDDAFTLMRYSHALSLNDTFWIKVEDEKLTFSEINLYDNKFDEAIGWIAFTGLPSNISRNLGTPELTTNGVLPKYWQRIAQKNIILCKGGTSGYANAGLEPYREVVVYIVATILGVRSIPYYLEIRDSRNVSISELFTTKEIGLITADEYIEYNSVIPGFRSLPNFRGYAVNDGIGLLPFYEMCLLDYLTGNRDRHLSNWGLSIDNATQKIIGLAPLWDNGLSLDFARPADLAVRDGFASFGISYDFVKQCNFVTDFKSRVNRLLVAITSGKLINDIYLATSEYYSDKALTENTVEYIKQRCVEFQKPLR